jgi:tyrosinase
MRNVFGRDWSRRDFVKDTGLIGTGLVLGILGGCEDLAESIKHRPVRRWLRTGSPQVDADIATYREAVSLMKALPATDPRSWIAQAGVHGTVAGGFLYCQHNNSHFFDWHRAYLFYFEKICQSLTHDHKFGLPYWNWNQTPDINPAYLNPASSLFLARTRTSMAGSWSVTTAALDPIFLDTNLFTFSTQIEGTPHNNVHTFIDNTMGTGGSALDPIFWNHHCMVDYCWAKWNIELGNNNTNDPAWISTVDSHFVDADGNVATATAGITTLMPLISYQYESSAIGSSPAVEKGKTKHEYEKLEKRIRKGANIRFDVKQRKRIADKLVVSIARPVSIQTSVTAEDFARILNVDPAKERVFLSIDFAQLPATSDFAVRVFLDLPLANADTPTTDPHFAGSFAFFGTAPSNAPAGGGTLHQEHPMFLVNITNTLQKLRQSQEIKAGNPISVQLAPTPFTGGVERANTQLLLEHIDILTTPVITNPPE